MGDNVTANATLLLSLDIDGTMEFGEPPGPLLASEVLALQRRGVLVGVASDWPLSLQRPLWRSWGIETSFVGGKHALEAVRARFRADRYLHVGDTEIDRVYANRGGFEFLDVADLPLDRARLLPE